MDIDREISREERWMNTVTNIDMTHNGKKAWYIIRKLTSDFHSSAPPSLVTANQKAHCKANTSKWHSFGSINDHISKRFSLSDIVSALKQLKCDKVSGVDNISVEQLKHLGLAAVS